MSEAQFPEIDDYMNAADFEGMDMDRIDTARDEYVNYLLGLLKPAFNFNDWHEQTHGTSVDPTVVTEIMQQLEEQFGDEAGDFLLNLHAD